MRANKRAIPPQFQKDKKRELHEIKFGFQKEKTLVSYVPKLNKAVILLSKEHHDKSVNLEESNKPEIILAYNATKGAVDTFSKMVAQYSCRRNTHRRPLIVFYFILDAAAHSTFVLYSKKNPQIMERNTKNQRRLYLEALGKELCKMQIQHRIQKWEENNFSSISKEKQNLARKYGFLPPEDTANAPNVLRSSGRCYMCPRIADKKSRNHCGICMRFVCKDHCVDRSVICESCQEARQGR